MNDTPNQPNQASESLRNQVRSAVIWRSGTQILGQLITWASTFLVIRILNPADYGLYAMTQVVLVLLNMLNGYGLASGLIQRESVDRHAMRQIFGMLILVNLALAILQVALAPLAAAYFRQPMVAHMLRVEALIYITTPFIAFPFALLARDMEFRRQAQVNFASAISGACAALAGAMAGLGVWTLVLAPITLFSVRAIGMMWAARAWMRPSFDFRGAGSLARYGGLMAAGQIFWFVQSQADVFIAGRHFDPHLLGIYTTSLFLTQIFVSKFVPPVNEVAFSAYARIQQDKSAVGYAFVKSVRVIMVAAMPFYLGLAVTAEPLVAVMLGAKWIEAGPIVRLLALAMPFMTLQVLFAPASDAMGRPGISARNSATGAILLSIGFLAGVRWGVTGLAASWLATYPLYLFISARRTLPVIGARWRAVGAAIAPPLLAASAMAALCLMVDGAFAQTLPPVSRLAILVATGAASYGALLMLFARSLVAEIWGLVRR
ncbi:lipopolysaccharide biosynthesis protein [Stakelama pacifica]|uniref:O-antigen/teichoic acid export membrane protein n=1 Tax=Stakelama pacifica TaxID=517720 RepID=A0A4R6FBB9_9SPHN|nr:lipopolysaccharide biosynthesis protein [Stakelama pacifica]TDN77860.1 O-antigen/teichoic acid export membrane protein [Stakelama pacifica]GGP00633.1 lipopolysaccharide biosynthesis protein [Stakelama pacifica]